ncbi:MAG: cyclic nucleotide-binding domain-containing protein [Pseudomonadota bacterium]
MIDLMDRLRDFPKISIAEGELIIQEGTQSDRIFVLVDGVLEVFRGDVTIALVSDPWALFGEMSALLDIGHTASVRAQTPAIVYRIEAAQTFLSANPDLAFPIAKLLAQRLQHATTYLVDLKRQFADRADHFGMVDEVLEALLNAPTTEFTTPDVERHERLRREDRED